MARPHAVAISLSEVDRAELQSWARRRKTARAQALRARIVLACAEPGATNTAVTGRLGLSLMTVSKWRSRFVRLGLAGLGDAPRSGGPRSILDEHVAAVVTTTLESTPPNATHWSSRALAARLGMSQTAISRNGGPSVCSRTAPRASSSRATRTSSTRCATSSGCT